MTYSQPMTALLLLFMLTLSPDSIAENTTETEKANCTATQQPLLDYTVSVLGSEQQVNLCDTYGSKLIMVVNTASKCAFTPQYNGLETLYARYKERGFVVLGFPSNDFAGQEPGTEKQIKNFCQLTYGVNFPMFEKTHVRKGKNGISPFYQQLARESGEYPGWNFHKYLISPDGQILASFKSHIKPNDPQIITMIEQHLPGAVTHE